jgi:hypothetical protein
MQHRIKRVLNSPLLPSIKKPKTIKFQGYYNRRSKCLLIQAEGDTLRSKIHKYINSIWNKEELADQWKEYIIASICKNGDKTDCSNY